MVTMRRTYPQPDSPRPNMGPRERALAVFKYMLDLEPEVAVKHPLFACIVRSYQRDAFNAVEQFAAACDFGRDSTEGDRLSDPGPSLIQELTSERDIGDLKPIQGEKL